MRRIATLLVKWTMMTMKRYHKKVCKSNHQDHHPLRPNQEVLQHSLTNFPFRNWCPHCVKGKAKASKHSATGGTEESAVPIVGFDYAFISDRAGVKPEDTEEDQKDVDDVIIKVLIGDDSRSRACTAILVPQKGLDPDKYAVG